MTAADGAPEFYDYGNTARYETPEEAVERDRALRSAYVGHNNVFFVDNRHSGGFNGKMNYTIATVNSLLGLPINKTRYKKFLLAQDRELSNTIVNKADFPTYHSELFRKLRSPTNFEDQHDKPFSFVSNVIKHTYLKAPEGSVIFVRQKSGIIKHDTTVPLRQKSFDYEHRKDFGGERV